jgi:hypothetical protein
MITDKKREQEQIKINWSWNFLSYWLQKATMKYYWNPKSAEKETSDLKDYTQATKTSLILW